MKVGSRRLVRGRPAAPYRTRSAAVSRVGRGAVRRVGCAAASLALIATLTTGCGDGTPAFCGDLSKAKNLDNVASALNSNDLGKASREAQKLKDLASAAPAEIRSDLTALADGVIDIIDLIRRDQAANSVSDQGASSGSGDDPSGASGQTEDDGDDDGTTTGQAPETNDDTQDDVTATSPPSTEPTDVEQRRNELNTRLGELDKRSEKVSNWALEQCGIRLQ